MLKDTPTPPAPPAFDRKRIETDMQMALLALEATKRQLDALNPKLGWIASLRHSVQYALDDFTLKLKNLDKVEAFHLQLLPKIRNVDPRFAGDINQEHDSALFSIFLNKDESYDTFKFVVGRLLKIGLTLEKAQESGGTVDYYFSHPQGSLLIYVFPGSSETCRTVEVTEFRSVNVKKVVCNGTVMGELPGATLTNPQTPDLNNDLPF